MPNELTLLQAELERSLAGLTDQQTQLRPRLDSRRWHIQQIVGHLLLTYALTITAMDTQIAKATRTRARLSLAQRLWQFVVLRLGWLPRQRKAPAITTPDPNVPPANGDQLRAALDAALAAMDARIAAAEQLFGRRRRAVRHMILGPLSLTQWRRFHLVHGRHHIRQIAAIRAEHHL
jgi:DinB superfamily